MSSFSRSENYNRAERGQFDHRKIESKWQQYWEKEKLYLAKDFAKNPKQYILIEFPYPSGERLHVGHGRSYCCFDAVARLGRMQGNNVLFPIGWDAFGLPAENYAIKTGVHPSITTKENIANAKKQAQSWGLSFDWEREINTTDPDYYKWTQWIFLQLYKKGLAYRAEIPVNWCSKDKINLADEEVIAGRCERCGTPVTRRTQSQWLLKITAYADRLIDDLESVNYREDIKAQQINWIGRSAGAQIKFKILDHKSEITVFTTRPDTLYGATFLVLSPEMGLNYLEQLPSEKRKEVEDYIRKSLSKSELQRQEELKDKTGVFTGLYALHPFWRDLPAGRQELPVWVADFVLSGYGTGAIMAVPAHDQRDFEFAKKYDLPCKEVIKNEKESKFPKEAFEREGILINSVQFDGLQSKEAIDKITQFLVQKKTAEKTVDYKLRDWVFSRQHYWGEPIPIVYCRNCWEEKSEKQKKEAREGYDFSKIDGKEYAIVTVSEADLPVELPYVENYKPTETGASPLAAIEKWVETSCPICNSQAMRETDTMPNWAGSSWYFLRYLDPNNDKKFADPDKMKYWMPVDWYNGGMEHTTLHLLYSRFWYKVLSDLGLVPTKEPYARRTSHGVVLGPDGQKMSKSRGNVVNPDEVLAEFGADTFRMYEAFMGPFDQMIAWDPRGVLGVRRFLDKVWKFHQEIIGDKQPATGNELQRQLYRLIKKVEEDTLNLKFNTAVAEMMKFVNQIAISNYQVTKEDWGTFLRVLAPYAPHLAEELWHGLGEGDSIHRQSWPKYEPKLIVEETVTIVVQVDGKMRGKMEVPAGTREVAVTELAADLASVKPHFYGKKVAKTIFIPDNLINFVTN
jgi:leucyl-tRNA synthetase